MNARPVSLKHVNDNAGARASYLAPVISVLSVVLIAAFVGAAMLLTFADGLTR